MAYVNAKAPKEVYHLTQRKNLPSILNEKVIKRFSDKECWFCESIPKLKKYMEYTVFAGREALLRRGRNPQPLSEICSRGLRGTQADSRRTE